MSQDPTPSAPSPAPGDDAAANGHDGAERAPTILPDAAIADEAPSGEEADDAAPSALAIALGGRRARFLEELARDELPPDLQYALRFAADPGLGETSSLEIVTTVACRFPDQPEAVAICGALAARIVARMLRPAENAADPVDHEALLLAAREAARDIAAGYGGEGLRMLVPLATYLARRARVRGADMAAVAAAMRRTATRLAGDASLGNRVSTSLRDHARPRDEPGAPSRLVLHGPVEIALHAR
jgi:hypothetical protein